MNALDSPLAKQQTSVSNMSANAGAELSIFWQSVLSSSPPNEVSKLKSKTNHCKNNPSIKKKNYRCNFEDAFSREKMSKTRENNPL